MRKHTSFPKKITIIFSSIIAVCLLAMGVMAFLNVGPFAPQAINPNSTSDAKSQPSKEPQQKPTPDSNHNETEKTPVKNEPTEPNLPSDAVAASITAANQNGTMLQIRTLIEAVSSSGSCKLTLNKNDTTHTYTAGTQAQASTSTCKGFDIPVPDLSTGTWNIAIDITINDRTNHLTKTITIN